nr:TPA_asm: hypothetical protein [Triaenorhabdovirus 1]
MFHLVERIAFFVVSLCISANLGAYDKFNNIPSDPRNDTSVAFNLLMNNTIAKTILDVRRWAADVRMDDSECKVDKIIFYNEQDAMFVSAGSNRTALFGSHYIGCSVDDPSMGVVGFPGTNNLESEVFKYQLRGLLQRSTDMDTTAQGANIDSHSRLISAYQHIQRVNHELNDGFRRGWSMLNLSYEDMIILPWQSFTPDNITTLAKMAASREELFKSLHPHMKMTPDKLRIGAKDVLYICPPLEAFQPTDSSMLSCSVEFAKLESTAKKDVTMVDPNSVYQVVVGCSCDSTVIKRACYTNFIGNVYTDETRARRSPEPTKCLSLCKDLFLSTDSSRVDVGPSAYPCYWMQDNSAETVVHTAAVMPSLYHKISKSVRNNYLTSGKCATDGTQLCKLTSGGLFLLTEAAKAAVVPTTTKKESWYVNADDSENLVLYDEIRGSLVCDSTCFVMAEGVKVYQCINGRYVVTQDFKSATCTLIKDDIYDPSFILPSVLPTAKDVQNDVLQCLTKKQVVINSLSSNSTLDISLLNSFNLQADADAGTLGQYYSSKGKIYSAKCVAKNFDGLDHFKGDAWSIRYYGKPIGCIDARLGIAFASGCVANPTVTSTQIIGGYTAVKTPDGWVAEWAGKQYGDYIKRLEDVDELLSNISDVVNYPGGVIITDPQNGNTATPGKPESEHGSSVLTDWWNSLGWSKWIWSVVLPIVLLALLLVFVIKKCC